MKITKTIYTATVNMSTVAVKDGKAETAMTVTVIHSHVPLSDEKIAKAVCKIDPKATIVSVTKRTDKYSIDIDEFVKVAHVEQ